MADLMDEQYEEQGMEMAGSDEDSEGEELDESQKHAYLPGKPMSTEETLVMDESAYIMYHQANTGAPCLSFDVMRDDLGERRETFPLSCYLVAGTQEELNLPSQLIIMKMTDLTKMETSDDSESSDSDSESDDDEDKKPGLVTAIVRHNGCVNRVKIGYVKDAKFAATWSETGVVYIWDMKRPLEAVDDLSQMPVFRREAVSAYKPVFSFAGHLVEGFAMDWSPTVPGRMATGDCRKNIHLWTPTEGGSWSVDQRPYSAHTSSVEDIQWSPVEDNVFASCSVDRTIRIWDARAAPNKACMLTAMNTHQKDVNVISWNRHEPFLLSGGDDGMIKVWDLRKFKGGKSVAVFKHHNGPITSLEWNPNDSSVFAASGQDHQVTLWDLAVERDNEDPEADDLAEPDIPPQLLFIHQGQQEVKEIHWHPQLPGVVLSTAADGFNVFRTISV